MGDLNILFLMSDEHLRTAAGCYGSETVKTPSLDRLAERGTRFTNAYTPSPICVPARAALATGRYVHQTRFWSNAQPYDGAIPSFGHRLLAAGRSAVSIGKLHYRREEDSVGFNPAMFPLHVRDGIGWARGLIRKDAPRWGQAHELAAALGPGECDYTRYDRAVGEAACRWLRAEAPRQDKPWTLMVSFVSPHYPLIVPRPFYDLYPLDGIERPRLAAPEERSSHPVVNGVRRFMNYDDYFTDETRRIARASYYGLCSFVDDQIGRVLDVLDETDARDRTLVIYTSDHGELIGNHGLWTKCVMYEEAAAIPLILSGPGIPRGEACATLASLVDCYPTVLEAAGLAPADEEGELPGRSLLSLANGEPRAGTVLSEYHDGGSITGMFMIRHGRWKYIHYPGYRPQLFDREADPWEAQDLGDSAAHAQVLSECEAVLRQVVDPDAANALAFSDQAQRIEALGGRDAIIAMEDYDFTPVDG